MTDSSSIKLNLENFQSIKEAELLFDKGITVLVGQSNSGKSAILRAVKALLTNPKGAQRFIKKGTEEATVTLSYLGNEVTWKKSKDSGSYKINGEDFIKVGGKDVFSMLNNSGFARDYDNNLLNIEGELDLPFPFDRSSSELFKLFENIFCVSDSALILKSVKGLQDEITKKQNLVKDEIESNKRKLEAIKELKEEVSIERLAKGKEELQELKVKTEELLELVHIMNFLKSLSSIKLGEVATNIESVNLDKYFEYIEDKLLIKNLKDLSDFSKGLKVEDFTIKGNLKEIEELVDLKKYATVISKLEELNIEDKEICLNLDLNKYIDLTSCLEELKSIKHTVLSLRNKEVELNKVLQEVEKELEAYTVCPLCGNNL